MNAVLYTRMLEPITVVNIPSFLWEMLRDGKRVNIEVARPMSMSIPSTRGQIIQDPPMIVTIFGERFRYRDSETIMLFTDDDEIALLLKAEFLPGQHRELQEKRQCSFAQGFLSAIETFGANKQ